MGPEERSYIALKPKSCQLYHVLKKNRLFFIFYRLIGLQSVTYALPSSPSCKTVQIPNNVAICVKPVNNIFNSRGKTWTLNALDLCMYEGER